MGVYVAIHLIFRYKDSKNVLTAIYNDKTYYADFSQKISGYRLGRSCVALFPCIVDDESKVVKITNKSYTVIRPSDADGFKNLINYTLHKDVSDDAMSDNAASSSCDLDAN